MVITIYVLNVTGKYIEVDNSGSSTSLESAGKASFPLWIMSERQCTK